MSMHPAVAHVMKFFAYTHLPAHLQEVSKPFALLAAEVANRAPDSQETTIALRKLLEAKDAAVRAALNTPPETVAQAAERGFRGTD